MRIGLGVGQRLTRNDTRFGFTRSGGLVRSGCREHNFTDRTDEDDPLFGREPGQSGLSEARGVICKVGVEGRRRLEQVSNLNAACGVGSGSDITHIDDFRGASSGFQDLADVLILQPSNVLVEEWEVGKGRTDGIGGRHPVLLTEGDAIERTGVR